MRLFVAVLFEPEIVGRLLDLQTALRMQNAACGNRRVNYSHPENLHLTLAFLGEVENARAEKAADLMRSVPFEPFRVTFDGTGTFGGGVYWVGVRRTPELMSCQAALSAALEKGGFALEEREYTPHITLARGQPQGEVPVFFEPFSASVKKISLMESSQRQGRTFYTELCSKEAET